MNDIQQAFPTVDLDESGRAQALERTTQRTRQVQAKRTRKRAILGTLAVGLLTTATVAVGPTAYAGYKIHQMTSSVDDCKTAVMTSYQLGKDGKTTAEGKIVYAEGKWNIDQNGRIQIYKDRVLWSYEPKSHRALRRTKPEGPFSYNPSGFSLSAMVHDINISAMMNGTTRVESRNDNGRPAEVLIVEQRDHTIRSVVYADPKNHMPYRMTSETANGDGWDIRSTSTFEFNTKVDDSLFSTKFPTGTTVIDLDNLRQEWAEKLESKIATISAPHRTIEIRDWFVNARGHVFVLFTDGQTNAEFDAEAFRKGPPREDYRRGTQIELEDANGAKYFRSDHFQPYINAVNGNANPYIALKDGQVLQGAWLVPAKPAPWKPTSFKINARIPIDPYRDEVTGSWTLKVDQPDRALTPAWADLCAMGPRNDQDILKEETEVHMVPDMIPPNAKPDKQGRITITKHYGR